MDIEEFRKQGKKAVDFICEYKKNIKSRRVTPGEDIKVGYLKTLIAGAFTFQLLWFFNSVIIFA